MSVKPVRILWTDDEIDLLQPHILFLKEKGYLVTTTSNGVDAIELVTNNIFDLIFLDENMPGLSGLETLNKIKQLQPSIPVVMITKNEEENIMDAAIGSSIADYLIKPVNPNQILLSIKKNIDTQKLITSKTTAAYQSEFNSIGMQIASAHSFDDWCEIYRKIVFWELELDKSLDEGMHQVFRMQKSEAGSEFGKFVKNNYFKWVSPDTVNKPLMSPHIFRSAVFPELKEREKLVFILIDNLRFDQWKVIQPLLNDYYITEQEIPYCSILPTSTQYARNAIFSGLMPSSIQEIYPDFWLWDEEEGNKNNYEENLFLNQLQRFGIKSKVYFEKIFGSRTGHKVIQKLPEILRNDIVLLIYNFVDMLSHANTDIEMVKELASSDSAYRSLTLSWFQHSDLFEMLKALSEKDICVYLTTDHGTVRVAHPLKVVGDKATSKNLRYKTGKNLSYDAKEVFEVVKPEQAFLPKASVSSRFIFALRSDFFAYPNNYNYYVSYYTNTYQHGGVSMEEMILPLIRLRSRNFS